MKVGLCNQSIKLPCQACHSVFEISKIRTMSHRTKLDFVIFPSSLVQSTPFLITFEWLFFFLWRCDSTRIMASSFLRFPDHTQRRSTVGRTPLDEWLVRRRDLYLTTHNTHNRQTSMLPVGSEPTISAGERPQTYALDRASTGTGTFESLFVTVHRFFVPCYERNTVYTFNP